PSPSGVRVGGIGRIIAIANQKGGVGKTTTAVNLATALAACDKRVLAIDFDPQGNASTGFGVDRRERSFTSYDVLIERASIAKASMPTAVPNLFLVPASVDLAAAELELVDMPRREFRLRDTLDGLTEQFDYVLIDCPPALGLLTINALAAADSVLVPMQCEFYALEGLSHLVDTIERVRRALNQKLQIQGVVLTMYDRRNNLCDAVAADLLGHFGEKVYETVTARNLPCARVWARRFARPACPATCVSRTRLPTASRCSFTTTAATGRRPISTSRL